MEQELREFGLTDKEIKVYLACLHLGTALVQDIARKSGTYRTYTYDVLKSLKEKGLVSHVIKSGKQYFEVAEPDKLLSILREKQNRINKIMPDLKGIYKSAAEKPKIELYEGKEGLKTILDDIIRAKKDLLVYCSARKQMKLLTYYFPKFIKTRVEKKIPIKVICEKSKESVELKKTDNDECRELRYLKEFPTATYIYGNKVAILSLEKDIIGVIIESISIAATQRIIFETMWGLAEK